jgi:cytidine deaminase
MSNEELIRIATLARKNGYAPLTNYKVGAALLAKSGTVYIGANFEAPSAIASNNCAERVAIQAAYAHGEREFLKIAIVGGNENINCLSDTLVPCGACLQLINEICKNVDIICYIKGKLVTRKIDDFLSVPYDLEK